MKTENNGLLVLFSVRQGRWVYLFSKMNYIVGWGVKLYSFTHSLDQLGFSVTCPEYSVLCTVTLKLLTGIHGKGYRLQ